jgi:hypothetical protein
MARCRPGRRVDRIKPHEGARGHASSLTLIPIPHARHLTKKFCQHVRVVVEGARGPNGKAPLPPNSPASVAVACNVHAQVWKAE